jgi:PAS domain S-box-containing protein
MEERKARVARPDPALFLGAFKASPIGIALEDLEGRPLFANPALCSMLGFSEDELRSKHCIEFSPPEDAQKDRALFEQLRAGSIDHYQLEKRFFRRDGSVIWGRLSISLVESGTSRLVVAMVEDLGEQKSAKDEVLRSEAKDEKLGGRLIQAQEAERARIVRDLHRYMDSLAVLAIDLDQFGRNPPQSVAQARQQFGEARQQVTDVISDIRILWQNLHSSELEHLGLRAAAASFCKNFSNRQKVKIDFHCEGIPKGVHIDIALCLYRVLQEALQNAAKHSSSKDIEVSLRGESNEIQLTVRDWGIGFDPAEAMKKHGIGLARIHEHLKLVDGKLLIESQTKQGATIHAWVPVKT